jgi:L-threonylcarbamoyladenylate synthase
MQDFLIRQAAICMQHGGVIAYPTEAVWGVGCDPFDRAACLRLLQIKHRPIEKGMILVAASVAQLAFLLEPLEQQEQTQLAQAWQNQAVSGPVTFLVKDLHDQIPYWVKGDHDAVALRVSGHPLVQALCTRFGGPVVSTSANPAGRPPAKSRILVQKQLGAKLDYVLPGALGGAQKPSRIIDLATGRIMRAA